MSKYTGAIQRIPKFGGAIRRFPKFRGAIIRDENKIPVFPALPDFDPIFPDVPDVPVTADYYLYGTPSESGNVAIADGEGYVLYEGDVLPNIGTVYLEELKETYPYVTMYVNTISKKPYVLLTNIPFYTNETGTVLAHGKYKAVGYGLNDDGLGWSVAFEPYESPIGGDFGVESIVWVNYDICLRDDPSVIFMPTSDPIPLVSAEPIRYEGDIPVYEKKE